MKEGKEGCGLEQLRMRCWVFTFVKVFLCHESRTLMFMLITFEVVTQARGVFPV